MNDAVTVGMILGLWNKLSTVPNPYFIQVSPFFARAIRKRMRHGAKWITISEEQRVELGMPVRSEKRYYLDQDLCDVDRRCLRRYERKLYGRPRTR